MVQTISWMVTRDDPRARTMMAGVLLRWFLVGGTIGGALGGLMLAGPARLVFDMAGDQHQLFTLVALVVTIAYLGRAMKLWSMPKPQVPQQVPSSWRDVLPPRIASFLYAGALGVMFFTRVGSLAVFSFVTLLLGLGRWPAAILAMFALAGLIRAATALIVPLFGWIDMPGLDIFAALQRRSHAGESAEVTVLGVSAALLAGSLVQYF